MQMMLIHSRFQRRRLDDLVWGWVVLRPFHEGIMPTVLADVGIMVVRGDGGIRGCIGFESCARVVGLATLLLV
jgi:hypothetical protein